MDNNYSLIIDYSHKINEEFYIVFLLNNVKYAINIKNVIEIINIPILEMPEEMPKGVIGLFNYNDNIIKAIDLSSFLGIFSSDFSLKGKLIVLSVNDNLFSIYTSDIISVTKFNNENIQDVPYLNNNSILKKIYKTDDYSINIIDCNVLSELISQEQSKKNEVDYSKFFERNENVNHKIDVKIKNSFAFPVDIQNSKQYVLFTLDSKCFYFDIKHVKEFISMKRLNITKLPYTSDFILGMVSVKGEFLVVVNLKKFLNDNDNSPITPITDGKLIITESKNFNIAFLVDDIKYIKDLNNVKKFKVSSNYIYAEFFENDTLYSILNFDEIINDEKLYVNI